MALKLPASVTVFGVVIEFPDAYHQVANLSGKFDVECRVDSYTAQGGEVFKTSFFTFQYSLNGNLNPIVQAYSHLKSLPEFSGAIDC